MHARARNRPLHGIPSRDEAEAADVFPSDDVGVVEIAESAERAENDEGSRPNEPICLACGGDGSRHEGCDHVEVARLVAPSRAAAEMIARLRLAAAEHRAASRALRALVTSELSRDRAELTTKRPPEAPAKVVADADAEQVPCPRCAEREAEGAPAIITAARASRKRGRAPVDQQTLPFTKRPTPANSEDLDDPGERTIERLLP